MAEAKTSPTWGGRFEKSADPQLEGFSASIQFDVKLWRQEIRASSAHARMLGQQGIISAEEGEKLVKGLEQVAGELAEGTLPLDPSLEDIHMNVEKRLGEIVGPLAGKLHSGRSRNDQVATGFALWMREGITAVREALLELRTALVVRASNEIDVVLPGYTHLQRAQPVRLAHHWLAHYEALTRDDARLVDARRRISNSPLGAGALAGTTLPIDRKSTAADLGFAGPSRNSLDSVSARDAALELLSVLAIVMVQLSRISEELVLWSSSEFGFIEIDDAFSTGSSLMPQKKNPDVPELVRGKSGRVVGDLVSLLMTVKGLPLAYNRDLQEDKEPVFDAVETATACLEILAATLRTLRVHSEAMAEAASDSMLLATDLAEHLVERGVPFREAHGIVGRVVRSALEANQPLSALSRDALQKIHPALDIEPATFFSVERSIEARRAPGSPSRENVERCVEEARAEIDQTKADLAAEPA
jgi:argininosuccinate lyase